MVTSESSPREYVKLSAVILGIVALTTLLAVYTGQSSLAEWMRWFMGVFFLVFGSFKLIGYRIFPVMFAGYDIVAKRFMPYAYLYPFIELALAGLYIANAIPIIRDLLTLFIMGVGSIGVWREVRRRSGIHCACLGNSIKLPLSTVSLVEDVAMGLMAAILLFWK